MEKLNNLPIKTKIIVFSFLGISLFIIVGSISALLSRIGKIEVGTYFAPFNSTIELNGTKISNNKTNFLSAGNYHIKVYLDHFDTYESDITISKDNNCIYGTLSANDEEGKKIVNKRLKDYQKVESIAGTIAQKNGLSQKNKYPILNYIPINTNYYSISYSYNSDSAEPIISIKANEDYTYIATLKLKTFEDIELEDYNITYTLDSTFSIKNKETTNSNPTQLIIENIDAKDQFYIGETTTLDNFYIATIYYIDKLYGNRYEVYKVILQKNDENWTITTEPKRFYTTYNTKNIPKDVLRAANEL